MKSREEWLKDRQSYIGASDIGAIVNQSSYKTALEIYLDKTCDEVKEKNTKPLEWGKMLEGVVADNYAYVTGYSIECEPEPLHHPDYSFIAANIDRWANNKDHLLECKTAHISKMKEWGKDENSDNIPDTYLCQVAQQALIADFFAPSGYVSKVDIRVGFYEIRTRACEDIDFSALPAIVTEETYPEIIGYKTYTYERNKHLEQMLLKAGLNFWNNHVLPRIPPEPRTVNDCALLYQKSNGQSIMANNEIEIEINKMRDLKAQQSLLTSELNESQVKIKSFMQDSEVLELSSGLVAATWRNTERGNRMFLIK